MQRAQGRFALGIRMFAALVASLALLVPSRAHAQAKPAPESWAGQLQAIGEWVASQKAAPCAQRCFTLDRMRITGDVGRGALAFEIRGDLLADGPVAVPLFGPPSNVRVEAVT